jgi:hypothetical protein
MHHRIASTPTYAPSAWDMDRIHAPASLTVISRNLESAPESAQMRRLYKSLDAATNSILPDGLSAIMAIRSGNHSRYRVRIDYTLL